MDDSTKGEEGPFFRDGFVLDVGSLYAHFEMLPDQRDDQGKRYPLALVLALVVLAKLAGEDHPAVLAERFGNCEIRGYTGLTRLRPRQVVPAIERGV